MSIKQFLGQHNLQSVNFGGMAKSGKATFSELMKPETFKRTMRSLVDFSPPKPEPEYLAGTIIPANAQQIDVISAPTGSDLINSEYINAESAYGRLLFGPIPYGHQREFFLHKKNVWVWHDSWLDEVGNTQGVTIRYEVRPTGVFKKHAGGTFTKIDGEELDNFRKAARMYLDLVKTNLYSNH